MSKNSEPTGLVVWCAKIAEVLEKEGCDARAAFEEAGLDWSLLNDPYARVLTRKAVRLWPIAVRMTGDPAIALKVVEQVGTINLHEYSVAILAAGTLSEAMKTLIKYSRFSTMMIEYNMSRHNGSVQISIEIPDHGIPLPVEGLDNSIAVIEKARRVVCDDEKAAPIRVELARPQPEDPGPWEKFFQCPVVFDAQRFCLYYDAQAFDTTLPNANPRLVQINQMFLEKHLTNLEENAPFAAKVSNLLGKNLMSNRPTAAVVASELGINASTLHRRLRKENLSFNRLLDQIRRDLADIYMSSTRLTLSEVTYMLGFSDQGNFTRTFKRWYGTTPSKYRSQRNKNR